MKILKLFLLLELIFLFTSCSIEKRHYQPGYHMDWVGSKKKSTQINKEEYVHLIPHKKINILKTNGDSIFPKLKNVSLETSASGEINSTKHIQYNQFGKNKKAGEVNIHVPPSVSEEKKTPAKQSTDGWYLLFGGLLGLLTFGLLKTKTDQAKNISYWAKNNKRTSRMVLAGLKVVLAGLGLYAGKLLFENDLLLTNTTTYSLIGASLLSATLYPSLKKSGNSEKRNYIRQKTHDLILSMGGFFLMASIGNQALGNREYFPLLNSVYETGIPSVPVIFTSADVNSDFNNYQTSNFADDKSTNEKQSKRTWQIIGKILLTILALSFVLLLEFIILGITCSLSCNGNEFLAFIVGIGGTLLCLLLAFFLMKKIWENKVSKSDTVTPVPSGK